MTMDPKSKTVQTVTRGIETIGLGRVITKNDAERLAAAINMIRPDWPVQSLLTLLRGYATRPLRDIGVALAWVALDPDSESPGRLAQDGPWWKAAVADRPAVQQPGSRNDPAHIVLARMASSGHPDCEHGEARGPAYCGICRNDAGLVANRGIRYTENGHHAEETDA